MTYLSLLGLVGTAALTACGEESGSGAAGADVPVAGVTWLPVSVTIDGKSYDAPPNSEARVVFEPGSDPAGGGKSGGTWGCNDNGMDVKIKGSTLEVTDRISTLMGCGEPLEVFERKFGAAIDGKHQVRLSDDGKTLTLTKAEGNGDRIVLSSEPRKPLVGPKWKVTGFTVTDGPKRKSREVKAAGEAFLRFTEDGGVSGNLGCNSFRAKATTAKDGTVTFGEIASTRRACMGQAGETEKLMREVLAGKAQYELGQKELSLTAGDGPSGPVLNATAE
ncbi:META domain-containing protein [Streptomyces sp. NA04227]|uniref:META domain-containing protein n=1 Tax=Streptomyces sp. NA04227 TaxID=2742136 RepID=UPI001591A13C|nr:META domain-containing protein [Streptomyces sp. NA04227]QKW09362.1 META domain-containing protein [Streptomyces sp. NA04227]